MSAARSSPLGPAFDLLTAYRREDGFFFERRGIGLCAWGELERIDAPLAELHGPVTERLARIAVDADVDRPVAVGALPFDRAAPASLHVPPHLVARDGLGARRLDLVPPAAQRRRSEDRGSSGTSPGEAFTELQLRAEPDGPAYRAAVAEIVGRIRGDGVLRKVVLARSVVVDAGRALDPARLVRRARSVDPDCYAFAAPATAGTLVGASPELLAEVRGRSVRLDPLAGSAPRGGTPDEDRASGAALLASEKEREEHQIVVTSIREALDPMCDELEVPAEPVLLGTANVWHLSTPISGRLREDAGGALDVVDALHPTPAVGGAPREDALAAIGELEPFDRDRYAGPVGWVDAAGDGTWAVALRCAELDGSQARLFAGAGIVAGSDPDRELDETERKFRALLDALRWG